MSLFEELKRRNVFRVGIAYVLLGWALLQGADFTLDLVGAPDWVIRALAVVVAIGLPIALFFAWAFELTPDGIKRESEVDRSESVMPQTGRKLDRAIIAFLVLVIAIMGLERFWPRESDTGASPASELASDAPQWDEGAASDAVEKSVAVLPFEDLSPGQDQAWFADGLAEEILNALAKTPDLLVASRTSSFNYRDSDLDVPAIGEALGVAHVLEGSVRSSGDRIRVTAQLIRTSDGFHVWSENYDRSPEDMIAIQEDLARSIAGILETTMDPEALAEMAFVGTDSVEAYRAYLQGLALQVAGEGSEQEYNQNFLRAYDLFEQARSLDPGFARAHLLAANFWQTQLALTRTNAGLTDLSARDMLTEYFERIDRAIANAPSDTDRLAFRGQKAQVDLRLREAIALYSEYLDARPQDELIWSNLLYVASLAEDSPVVERALGVAKERGRTNQNFAQQFINEAYRHDRVTEAADYGLELVDRWPTNASLVYQAHRTLLWDGRVEQAARMAERYRRLVPGGHVILDTRQACAEADRATAERLLQNVEAEANSPLRRTTRGWTEVSTRWHLNMLLGEQEHAEAVLRPLEETGVPYVLADFMIYHQFDPTPFPSLLRVLEREKVDRPPAAKIPFACPPPEQTSIAVLPFVNMSSDADNEYFSDGVSEEILNVLAAIPELKVASRTSAFRYKGSDLGIDEIAGELGVTHVLEGSVRKAGDQVRITAQLIQASDGFHLWSETYDRELDNIFAIQDEIAGNIADVLEVQLLGGGKAYTTVQDLSPEDYEKFLKARFLLRQRNDAAMAEAIGLTREVLANTPDFPVGLTQLAEGLVQFDREDGADQILEIRTLVDRALALEPDLAPAHMLEGQLAMDELRPLEALRHFERAIALDPNEPRPHHWLGILLANSGYLDRARRELETAVKLEPDHANANGYLGFVLLLQGDYDGAQRQFERQDRLGNPFGAQRKVQVAALKGERALAEQLVREREGFTALEAERLQYFIVALQDPQTVGDYVAFIEQNAMDDWHVALELSILGQYERALAFDFGGYPRWSWADRFVEARALPAFQEKIQRANLPTLWAEIGPPPACRAAGNGYDCANGGTP